jgi:hypothetical protein
VIPWFQNLVFKFNLYRYNEVLKYLSFAVSTLAKCAKIIPVMIWVGAVQVTHSLKAPGSVDPYQLESRLVSTLEPMK